MLDESLDSLIPGLRRRSGISEFETKTKNGRAFLVASLYGFSNNKKVEGYDAAVYAVSSGLQILVTNAVGTRRPVTCLQAAVSEHRIMATLNAGRECKEYEVRAVLEKGTFAHYPAVRLMVDFLKVPPYLKCIGKELFTLVPGIAFMMGLSQKEERNPPQQMELIVGQNYPQAYLLVIRLPNEVIYATNSIVPAIQKIEPFSLQALNGICSVNGKTITTFNKEEIRNVMPENCFQILVKDCKQDSKFLVMMKEQSENPEYREVMVMFGSMNIHLRVHGEKLDVTDNAGKIKSFPHKVRTETGADSTIEIDLKKNKELVLLAHEYGLEKLTYDGVKIKVEVNDEMRGALCGLCGKFDDETLKKYLTPTGYSAKNEKSFVLSWVSPAVNTSVEACKLQHEFVEDSTKEQSKCRTDMPVLRCGTNCTASKTEDTTVDFHCRSSDSTEILRLEHRTVQYHTACSCE
ncbi:vitellogenin-2-like [Hemicordylus capensis]|uniref:vitellogenin-2-like n=1 Tax=Hemicordylus capensis TaxID=884348 RepID=UPI002303B3F4|nr:vitellogenin-2-like [Hemicordylus capensis]